MIGFIGGGNMAEAFIKGMTKKAERRTQKAEVKDKNTKRSENKIIVSEPLEERRKYIEQTYRVNTTASNKEVVNRSDIIFLAVKPQNIEDVLREISALINERKTIVSIAAGITLSYLESKLGTKKIIRVMPNTPAIVQEGMSVMSLGETSFGSELEAVRIILESVGRVLILPEDLMNAVTALSGSGPGFIAFYVEAIIETGEAMGLSRDDALRLSVQTLLGTAKLLDSGMPPDKLRKMVTSPGGTTEAGLKMFEEKGLKGIITEGLNAARKRAEELGRK